MKCKQQNVKESWMTCGKPMEWLLTFRISILTADEIVSLKEFWIIKNLRKQMKTMIPKQKLLISWSSYSRWIGLVGRGYSHTLPFTVQSAAIIVSYAKTDLKINSPETYLSLYAPFTWCDNKIMHQMCPTVYKALDYKTRALSITGLKKPNRKNYLQKQTLMSLKRFNCFALKVQIHIEFQWFLFVYKFMRVPN